MNVLKITKIVTEYVVSAGVGTVVGHAINSTTPDGLKVLPRILTSVGSVVLTSAAASHASKYLTNQFDEITEQIKQTKIDIQNAKDNTTV